MLLFQGIINEGGKIEKYRIEYKLRISYIHSYRLLEKYDQDITKAIADIKQEIDAIYQKQGAPLSKEDSFFVATRTRSKELLVFFQKHARFEELLQNSLKVLVQKMPIKKKVELIIKFFELEKFENNFLEKKKNRDFLEDFLLFIWLDFLDQIEESPPLNLRLYFVSGQFPKCNWSVTDYSEKLKIKEWEPVEEFCQLSFLRAKLWRFFYTPSPKIESNNQLPEVHGKLVKIQLACHKKEDQEYLLESNPDEALRVFIQEILSDYRSQKGSNHFLAMLYQIQKNYKNGSCLFDWKEHFQLVSKYKSPKNLKAQVLVAHDIFQRLQNLKVIRVFQADTIFEVHNSLVVVLNNIYQPEQKFIKKNLQQNQMQLQIDPVIIPSSKTPLSFSSSLYFLPLELFQENSKTYHFLLLLCVYLYDCWLYDYKKSRGKVYKKAKDMIVGSCIKVTENSKYRFAQRLRSALQYLKKKNYIGNYQLQNSSRDILDTSYLLSAPMEFHKKIEDYYQQGGYLTFRNKALR